MRKMTVKEVLDLDIVGPDTKVEISADGHFRIGKKGSPHILKYTDRQARYMTYSFLYDQIHIICWGRLGND